MLLYRCKEDDFFASKGELDIHHKRYHSHLRPNYKLVRRSFLCRQCGFDTPSLEVMQRHAKQHLNVYRCKLCPEAFKTFFAVKNHFKMLHQAREPETRNITNEDISKEIDETVTSSARLADLQLTPVKDVPLSPPKTPPNSPRLAKKSTTKQAASMMQRPCPAKIKAVARKSTNPLPRYPTGLVFPTDDIDTHEYVSHYGRPKSPVDLASLSTTMALAGLKMKVNCAKLAELFNINIEPTLVLRDFMKEKAYRSQR